MSGRASGAAVALDCGSEPLGFHFLRGVDPAWWAGYCAYEDEIIRRDETLQQIELELCARSRPYFLQRYFWIEDKATRRSSRLLPNPIQLDFERRRGLKNIVLKPRKVGISTWIDAGMFWSCRFSQNMKGLILSHLSESTIELFARLRFAEERLAPWLRTPLERYTTTLLRFEALNSQIRVLTAGGQGQVGRGGDTDALHLSERAFYPDQEKIIAAAGESLRPGAQIDHESSPNGSDRFREDYVAAREGSTDFVAHFWPWYFDPTNRDGAPDGGPPLVLTTEERKFRAAHRVDDGQMRWRRRKKKELKSTFPQEHPEDDETCFLLSGVPRFDKQHLSRLLTLIHERVVPVPLDEAIPDDFPRAQLLRCEELTIWAPPLPGHRYLIPADVAGGGGGDADFSYAEVLDITRKDRIEQVARFRSNQIRPGPYGRYLAALGLFYNEALVAPEENNHGHATLYAMQQEGYPEIYYHVDLVNGKERETPGFPTTQGTRAQGLDMLASVLLDGGMVIRDDIFVRECLTFEVGDEVDGSAKQRSERRRSVKKDGVMTNAIGVYVAMRETG